MVASAWSPTPTEVTQANASGTVKDEVQIATAGQRNFVLNTFAYAPNTNSIQVYKNGTLLKRVTDYTEVDTVTLALVNAAVAGDQYIFVGFIGITGTVGTDPTLRANLLATAGATLVGFLSDAPNASGSTLKIKVNEIKSVNDFGVVGDGVTDDTTALQTAFNSLASGAFGRLLVPSKKYKTTAPLTYNGSNGVIEAMPGATIVPYACDGLVIGNPNSTTYTDHRCSNITVSNLAVDMSNAPGKRPWNFVSIDELKLRNISSYKGKGILYNYVYNSSLLDCISIVSEGTALDLTNCCDKTVIIRGQYGNSQQGIIARGGKGITLIGVSCERNQLEGFQGLLGLREGTAEWGDGYNFMGNYFERNCQAGGEGFISLGAGTDTSDYSKGHNISGNYLNWDAGNPAVSANTPLLCFGKVSEISISSNRYINTSNYVKVKANAYKQRLNFTDLAGEQAASTMLRCEVLGQLAPVAINITTDSTGYGVYTLDVTAYYAFTSSWLTLALGYAAANPNMNLQFAQVNPTKYTLYLRNAPVSSSVPVNALILGKLV